MKHAVRETLAVLALVVGAGGALAPRAAAADEAFAAQAALFAYDAKVGFDVKEFGTEKRDGATVKDLTFNVLTAEPVKAYLVVPDGKGPFAGVLWVHWLGEPETTNRTEFLIEAVGLASRGIVSLLVDAMWSSPKWYESRVPEEDYANSIRQVVALRRAMDLLAAQPSVDKVRLGFVGHDYGGMYGMLAAGVAPRAKTYVYVAVAPSLNHWAFFARQPRSKAEYLRQNALLELSDYVQQVKNASTLFQFAKNDAYVSRADTQVLMNAAADRKEKKFYDADHAMHVPQAAEDRDAWLLKELGGEAVARSR
jgi:dienelactone hydrolase